MATIKISDLNLTAANLQFSISDLQVEEMEQILGGKDSLTPGESIAVGVAAVGLSILIVSNPVGWFGLTAAVVTSYSGGLAIGSGINKIL